MDPENTLMYEQHPTPQSQIYPPPEDDKYNVIQVDDSPAPELPKATDYEEGIKYFLTTDDDLETEAIGYYTWHLTDWKNLDKRLYSPEFIIGNTRWRILLFPFGNNSPDSVAIYLEALHESSSSKTENSDKKENSESQVDTAINENENDTEKEQEQEEKKEEEDWHVCAQFSVIMHNVQDPSQFFHMKAEHRFYPAECDWGFSKFYDARKVLVRDNDRDRPLVENDETAITLYIRILKDETGVLWHNFVNYNSKKETGFVGLKNQGATCYMNSLLQSLYFTNYFRRAVFQIPTENDTDPPNSNISLALQRIFFNLQFSYEAVGTNELTRSFGWDARSLIAQHDVTEFNKIIQENLEGKMKNTDAEGAITRLLYGQHKSVVKCLHVDYESPTQEAFGDIHLNIKGVKDLRSSFLDYIQVETLEDKYNAEGYGPQEAQKGLIFQNFPPVLHLQLKRFGFDYQTETMFKVNDRFEFSEEIDMVDFLDDSADKSESWKYILHGVLVHSGEPSGGHYYAFLKPEKNGQWYKFDDDRVTKALHKEVFDDSFGGEMDLKNGLQRPAPNRPLSKLRFANAYMLVYLRASKIDEVMRPIEESEAPAHIRRQVEEERAAAIARKKEMDELHLYTFVKVLTNDIFRSHDGFDISNLEDKDRSLDALVFKTKKTSTLAEFKSQVASRLNLEPSHLRFWMMVNRQNKTTRPDVPVSEEDMSITIEKLRRDATNGRANADFRLWLDNASEVGLLDSNGKAVWPKLSSRGEQQQLLIFIKHFDVEKQTLHGVGEIYVNRNEKVQDLVPKILKKVKFSEDTSIKLYEEIKPTMIELLPLKRTFAQAEIQDGDIVCFQKDISDERQSSLRSKGLYTSIPEFYDWLVHKVNVLFRPRYTDQIVLAEFELTLGKKQSYDAVASKVAEQLDVPATHLRFTSSNPGNEAPRQIIKPNPTTNLNTMLSVNYLTAATTVLYYEVLEIPLAELDTKKALTVTWLPEGLAKEEIITLLMPKQAVISNLFVSLLQKFGLDESLASFLTCIAVHNHRVYKILPVDYSIAGISDAVQIFIAKKSEEEVKYIEGHNIRKESQPQAKEGNGALLINCFHFYKELSKLHGIPFRFVVIKNESLNETRRRLIEVTKLPAKEFEKVKIAVVPVGSFYNPRYIEDDEILSDVITNPDDSLALDHLDRSARSSNYRTAGNALSIRG